jgi:hypothetical protein
VAGGGSARGDIRGTPFGDFASRRIMHSHDIVSSLTGGTCKKHYYDDEVRALHDEKVVMYDTRPGIHVAE